ncbi:MAG: hypothetical protein QXN53_06085 [Thermoproteota archaeon]
MYDRYVDFMIGKGLAEKIKAEEKEEVKNEQEKLEPISEDSEPDQETLLEIIKEKGIGSPEGKSAYDELLRTQLKEINRLEDEYRTEDRLETNRLENSELESQETSEQAGELKPEGKSLEPEQASQGEVEELSQTEIEQAMSQLEGELFNGPKIELNEIEKAETLAEQVEMDRAEIEDLVQTTIEETKLESSELGPEISSEVEEEADEAEV